MSRISETKMTVRMPDDLNMMTKAVAVYEDRRPSDVVRVALKHYFGAQGYFEPDFIAKLAAKETRERKHHE
jgi:predicted transcriptional regulator